MTRRSAISLAQGEQEGTRAAEICVKLGQPAPAKDVDWVFQQAAQRPTAEMDIDHEDIGKPRWVRALD